MGTQPPVPAGLSEASTALWRAVMGEHRFEPHETATFESYLRWRDRSEQWMAESKRATGRDQARLVKQGIDAAQTSLRHLRALKFTDPDALTRRPGRPAGDNWSAKRKAQARLREVG